MFTNWKATETADWIIQFAIFCAIQALVSSQKLLFVLHHVFTFHMQLW
jgi:hypothetical protein